MLHRFNAQVVAVSRTQSDLQGLHEEIGCETLVADLGNVIEARQAVQRCNKPERLEKSTSLSITLR